MWFMNFFCTEKANVPSFIILQTRDVICARLADKVKKCSLGQESKQMILKLLGKKFVEKHLSGSPNSSGEVSVHPQCLLNCPLHTYRPQ